MPVIIGCLDCGLAAEFGRFGFEGSDFLLELFHFAGLVILLPGTSETGPEILQLLANHFQAFLGLCIHRGSPLKGDSSGMAVANVECRSQRYG
jgi:hypothetical protein